MIFNTKKGIKFKIVAFSLVMLLSFSIASPAMAKIAWPEPIGNIMGQVFDLLMENIQGIIVGALKQAAVSMLNEKVGSLVSGSSMGDSLIIQDWTDELAIKPAEKTALQMKDILAIRLGGRGGRYDYVAYGQDEGIQGNYYGYLQKLGKGATESQQIEQIKPYEYCDDPANPFAGSQKNYRCFSSIFDKPFGLILDQQMQQQILLAQNTEIAKTQAIAYKGYKGQTEDGYIITPGSTIAEIQANTQNLGNEVIANADNVAQVIASLVAAIAVDAIQGGIGSAQKNVQKEKINPESKWVKMSDEKMGEGGPGEIFKEDY